MRKRTRDAGSGGELLRSSISRKGVGRATTVGRKPVVDKKKGKPRVGGWEPKSGLERNFGTFLEDFSIPFTYEPRRYEFLVPEQLRHYTPDFEINDNKTVFETKGKFTSEDRKKMLLVLTCHPDLNLWMVFPKPQNRITKVSKTTYASWCEDHGIPWIELEELKSLIKDNKKSYANILFKRRQRMVAKGRDGGGGKAAGGARKAGNATIGRRRNSPKNARKV